MLTRVEALGYRSLRYTPQEVATFQTLVGPNGSGKSTFLDVVGFIGDLLKVGPLRAIVGDGQLVQQRASDLRQLTWMRERHRFELAVEMVVPEHRLAKLGSDRYGGARYRIAIETRPVTQEVVIAAETLWLIPDMPVPKQAPLLFPQSRQVPDNLDAQWDRRARRHWKTVVNKIADSGNDSYSAETGGWNSTFRLGPTKSALANLPDDEERFPVATWVRRLLIEGVRKVVLNAEAIRRPAPPGSPRQYQTDGSNLPWVIDTLASGNAERFDHWIAHFQTAIPDLKTITTVSRPEDNHRYLVVEYQNGLKAPSWVVSDGTLRMLALTLLAYVDDAEAIYLIEEPENGLYPKAIETVYESLRSVYSSQVLCASHSPVVLGLAQPSDLLCFSKNPGGSTDIVSGDRHPRLKDWQGTLDLGALFAAGVLG